MDETSKRRVDSNKPFGCIDVEFDQAANVIPRLDLERQDAIVWLDYQKMLDEALLSEVSDAAQRLRPGSVLVVTVNAQPDELAPEPDPDCCEDVNTREGLARTRLGDATIEGFIEDRPDSPAEYGLVGLPRLQSRVLQHAVTEAAGPDFVATPFLNLRYADNAQMQTVAWLVTDGRDEDTLQTVRNLDWTANGFVQSCLDDPDFVTHLDPPMLTARERTELNVLLPEGNLTGRANDLGLQEAWATRYASMYRWYPRYVGAAVTA